MKEILIKRIFPCRLMIFVTVFALMLSFAGCSKNRDLSGNVETTAPSTGSSTNSPDASMETIDARAYLESHTQIIGEVAVADSINIPTESETVHSLTERGFSQYPITAPYQIDGTLYENEDISEQSENKHPIYETYYMTQNRDIWTITIINGAVMANPVSYNFQSGSEVKVMISETDTIMTYDSAEGKFYETIPHETSLIVKTVPQINAETLEKLTFEEIEGL